ncbi:MAG: hypothetical protein ABIT76_13680 [Chthoniobacterales bacterium]
MPKAIIAAGNQIVLLADGSLSMLSADAAPGARFKGLGVAADILSKNSTNGRVALGRNGKLFLVNLTDKTEVPLPDAPAASIDLGPDGSVYVESPMRISARAMQPRGRVTKFLPDGKPDPNWPRDIKGRNPVRIGDFFFSFDPNGTINRLNALLEADPGPVMGGMTGTFFGRLKVDPDLGLGIGLARLHNETYAISGEKGAILLASWDESRGDLTIGRRLGALPTCAGLNISANGTVLAAGGVWKPDAPPDAPLQFGLTLDATGFKQPCERADGNFVVPVLGGGRAGFAVYDFKTEPRFWDVATDPFSRDAVGAVEVLVERTKAIVVIEPDGTGRAYQLRADGKLLKNLGELSFRTSIPIRRLTAISKAGNGKFFASCDGRVVELELQGREFVETARWDALASSEPIYLSADGSALWVCDPSGNRVLCYDIETRRPLAVYEFDLDGPTIIAARNGSAVVYDHGHQRILRLQLQK